MVNADRIGKYGMDLSIISVILVIAYFLWVAWGDPAHIWALKYTFYASMIVSIIGLALSLYGYKETRSKYGLVGLIIAAVVLSLLIFGFVYYGPP